MRRQDPSRICSRRGLALSASSGEMKEKQKEERREKRANGRQPDSLNVYRVPEGREGAEKSRTLGETREERKEKQEERDNHNPDERAEESNSSVSEWCRKRSRLLGTESMA